MIVRNNNIHNIVWELRY